MLRHRHLSHSLVGWWRLCLSSFSWLFYTENVIQSWFELQISIHLVWSWLHVCYILLLLCLGMGLEFLVFPRLFMMKGWWILSNAFSTSNEMMMYFFLEFFISWSTLMDFHILNHPCNPGKKPTWSYWMIILICS